MPMEIGTMVALVISAVVVLFAGALISFPFICFYFWHRRRVLELKGTHAQQVSALQDRMENLELKCHKLQQQVTDAHMLLSDERRELDKKLAESFPDIMPPIPDEPAPGKSRSRKRERTRE